MKRNDKKFRDANENNERTPSKICCMECGSSRGTLHKVKGPNGKKGYLCDYCFEDYSENYN